jgi:ribosome maturation factor RimP
MNFRRTAKRLLERKVLVDTVNKSYQGKLKEVEKDYIILSVMQSDKKTYSQIIIRVSEIVALSPY